MLRGLRSRWPPRPDRDPLCRVGLCRERLLRRASAGVPFLLPSRSVHAISYLVFHNNGDGTFTDVSKQCGIAASPGKGLGIAINDFDRDGWPDIFVANDSVAEQLFRNNHDGTFAEVALEVGLAYDQNGRVFAGMGADFADYNNDGWPDVFVNALANQKYTLFRNHQG